MICCTTYKNFNIYISTTLSFRLGYLLAKRFFPGNLPINHFSITPATARRILKVFSKSNLTDSAMKMLPSENESINALQQWYMLHGKRTMFFQSMRNMPQDYTLTVNSEVYNQLSTNIFAMVNTLGKYVRVQNLPLNNMSTESTKQLNTEVDKKSLLTSLEDKINLFQTQREIILNEMYKFKEQYHLKGDINSNIINLWYDYLQTRQNILPLNEQEKEINVFLENLLQSKSKETNLDNNAHTTFTVTIDTLPIQEQSDPLFTEEDYLKAISNIKNALSVLQSQPLTEKDITSLSRISKAVILDEEGNLKLTTTTYDVIRQNATLLSINYTNDKPDRSVILEAIKNGDFIVRNSSDIKPQGSVISTAPILHKTILVFTQQGILGIGMHTSAKQNTSILSPMQESNLDETKRNKEQRFLCFSYFIKYEHSSIEIDLLTQGFDQGINISGQDVKQMLFEIFQDKSDVWSNNFIEEPFVITAEVLRKISLIFFQHQLDELESKYHNLISALDHLDKKKQNDYRKDLADDKQLYLQRKEDQKYFSSLSPDFQIIYKALKLFAQIEAKQQTKEKEQKQKQQVNAFYENSKKLKESEKSSVLSAKDKKEKYLKDKLENQKLLKNEQNS